MKTVLTVLLTFSLIVNISAKENNIFKGYIIKKSGQRIEGKIKTKNVTVDQMKIVFLSGDSKIVYKPTELIGYGYEFLGENSFGEETKNWRHYKSKKAISYAPRFYASKNVFMEVMEQGQITLYDYYVETPRDINNPYVRYFYMEREGSNELVEISEDNYIASTSIYLEDNYELSERIGTVNHRFRHLWKIVRLYNDWSEMQNPNTRMADFEEDFAEEKPF